MKPSAFASSLVFVTLILALGYALYSANFASASAPSGLPAQFSSSTSMTASVTAASTISATSSRCTSRVISTSDRGLMLTFDDSDTPTATVGHWQGASTTVAYDCGLYGYGAIKARASGANSTIFVSVFE